MNNLVSINKLVPVLLFLSFQLSAQSMYLDDFPSECANATDQSPLPGHIIRLGFVAKASYGWSFFFPDQRIAKNLQRVVIAENVGLIGQDPDEDLGAMIRARTPNGSFVVGQIFVSDEDQEPVVTCISRPMLLNNYNPSYFGSEFSWLNRDALGNWLSIRKFSAWNWRKWWGKDFRGIRDRYKEFYRHDRQNRERDRAKHTKEGQKWRKNNEDRNRPGHDVEHRDDKGVEKKPDDHSDLKEPRKWKKSNEKNTAVREIKRRGSKDSENKSDKHQDQKGSKKQDQRDGRNDTGKKERETKTKGQKPVSYQKKTETSSSDGHQDRKGSKKEARVDDRGDAGKKERKTKPTTGQKPISDQRKTKPSSEDE